MDIFTVFAWVVCLLSAGLYLLQTILFVLGSKLARRQNHTDAQHFISVLKPLSGQDDDLRENLESFAHQVGVRYELLLGVASYTDPAAAIAKKFLRDHPQLNGKLVLTDPSAAMNPKVAQLIGLEQEAGGEVLVISDSNVRVRTNYLQRLVNQLSAEDAGVVSNVISGTGGRSIGAMLDNLIMSAYAAPGIFAGGLLTNKPATIGKSMAMFRDRLNEIGGFQAFGGYLAEDHAIGKAMARQGYKVSICAEPIENRNCQGIVRHTWSRHLRWAKIRRTMVPLGFALEPLAWPWFAPILLLVVEPTQTSFGIWLGMTGLQWLGSHVALRTLGQPGLHIQMMPLDIIRGWMLVGTWLAAWISLDIVWRGHRLRIASETRLIAPTPRTWIVRILSWPRRG